MVKQVAHKINTNDQKQAKLEEKTTYTNENNKDGLRNRRKF